MAPERSLLPPQPPSTSQSQASVIGVVPSSIHSLLSSPSSIHGSIDQNSSGLSYLVVNNSIHIWEHSIQTLNEELAAPKGSLKLVHPEYTDGEGLKVVTVSPKENKHLVYASSASGVICLWMVDTKVSLSLRTEEECDASVRLDLEQGEYITTLTAFGEWIFATVSSGQIYKLRMTSRPLGLHAKLITREMEGGIMSGLYNRLFTPKKTRAVEEEEEAIIALVSYHDEICAGGRSPPRHKVAKLSPCCRAVTFTPSLSMLDWKISLASDDDHEGVVAKKKLFEQHYDGTLNLEALDHGLVAYTRVELMAKPVYKRDSIVAVLRISSNEVSMTRAYVVRIGLGSDDYLSIIDSVWLDRYAGQSISPGGLDCYGVIGGDTDHGCLVYVGFGRQYGVTGEDSVTISAINFGAAETDEAPRIKDLDLLHHVIPSLMHGCMTYDSTTGGCMFLASSGLIGGASVRFPRIALPVSIADEGMGDVGNENILAIKTHLISAFRQFVNKLRDGKGNTNHAAIARSVVPPSVNSCSPSVLTAAVVMSSQDFLTNSGGMGGFLSPAFKSPSPIVSLQEKLQLHTDFVNFLLYAGAWKKVSTDGRISLRDHGEMLDATKTCFIACQKMVENLADLATDNARREEIKSIRHVIKSALQGAADNVIDLPSRWARLQQTSMNDNDDMFRITSIVLCNGIGGALQYRQETSPLYDIPIYDIPTQLSSAPWTSSIAVLEVLQYQLKKIDQTGRSFLDNATNFDDDKAILRSSVEDMSAALLGGYRDIVNRSDDNNACQMYESAKQLCIPLLRQFANDNGDDLCALKNSLKHEYFEGIVQICHEHRGSWMHCGSFSHKQADKAYDLRPLLQYSPDCAYNLKDSVDFRTKLNFRGYVLRFYANKGLKSKVFELGHECPDELNQLVTDHTLQDMSWINSIRFGLYPSARDGLLNNACDSLWEKETNLSLAKLSNVLAPDASSDHNSEIQNRLALVSAQHFLQETDSYYNAVMSADELIALARSKINLGSHMEEIKDFVIRGLEVAATMSANQRSDYLSAAASIWEAAIKSEMPKWQSLLQDSSMSVAGVSFNKYKETVFVGACTTLAGANDEKLRSVGYLTNPAVRDRVKQSMGFDESMEKLFISSAQIACS